MRKQLLISAAFAALALVSCNREPAPADSRPIQVTVSIQGAAATRVTSAASSDESKVNNLQLFVFNGNALEDYVNAGAETTVQLTASSGNRTIWALVNAPEAGNIQTVSQLESTVSRLADNARDSFVMTGAETKVLQDNGNITIPVRRIVSKVSVKKISTAFQNSLASETLTLNGIYLINVAGDYSLSGGGTPSLWLNKLKYTSTDGNALLYDAVQASVRNGSPYETEHAFYPYPNPTAAETYAATWSARHTMLVVEVTLQGKKGYYPVELPVLERNKTYTINELVLKHRPGDVPYKPLETGDATVSITVNDWETGQLWTTLIL